MYVCVCVLDCVCQCLSQLWRAARYATSMMAWFSASTLPGHMWVALTQTWTCRIHMLHVLTARTSSWLYAFLRNLISKSPFANSSKEIVPDPSWKPSESLTISIFQYLMVLGSEMLGCMTITETYSSFQCLHVFRNKVSHDPVRRIPLPSWMYHGCIWSWESVSSSVKNSSRSCKRCKLRNGAILLFWCFLYIFSVMLVTPSDIAIWTVNIYIYIYLSIILYWIACSPRYPGFQDLRRRYPLPQQLSSQNEGSAEMLPRFSNFSALV